MNLEFILKMAGTLVEAIAALVIAGVYIWLIIDGMKSFFIKR